MFILNSAILLNSLMSSNCFFVASLVFSIYSILFSENNNSFTSFPVRMPLFSCLTAVARTSNTMVNRIGESSHSFLVCDLTGRKEVHVFTLEYDVSCGFVIYGFYYVEVCSLYTHFVECFFFIIKGY